MKKKNVTLKSIHINLGLNNYTIKNGKLSVWKIRPGYYFFFPGYSIVIFKQINEGGGVVGTQTIVK